MPIRPFTIFQDQHASCSANTATTSTGVHARDTPLTSTKENINPLTGLVFDSQPPLKKRKPSSSCALKAKPLPSSSKVPSKPKRSSANKGKDKGKKKTVLGVVENRVSNYVGPLGDSEVEQLRTALGNRNAYDLTVMPLADVTQAYDQSEATSVKTRAGELPVEDEKHTTTGMVLLALSEENDIKIHNMASKETTTPLQTVEA